MDAQISRDQQPITSPSPSTPRIAPALGLIARLYPKIGKFSPEIIERNRDRYHEPSDDADGQDIPRAAKYRKLPYIELNFGQPPKHRQGFVFGHAPEYCDVVLDKQLGTNPVHFVIGYSNEFVDNVYRLVVQDFGSAMGTMVTFGIQAAEFQSNTTWTVTGFSFADSNDISITMHNGEEYIVVPRIYDTKDENVIRAITQYSSHRPDLQLPLPAPEKSRFAVRSGTPTMAIEKQLMGCVRGFTQKVWNTSNAQAFVLKRLICLNTKEERAEWIASVRRFQTLRHEHILHLVAFKPDVHEAFMPWRPHGNIIHQFRNIMPFRFGETLVMFQQCLNALDFLHQQNIAHGNLRPENILVLTRGCECEHDKLHVQLSDFGILETKRAITDPRGSQFKAPEILARPDRSKRQFIGTPASDLWSLGVILLQAAYNRVIYSRVALRDAVNHCLYLHQMVHAWRKDELVLLIRQCIHYCAASRSEARCILTNMAEFIQTGRLTYEGPPLYACIRAKIPTEEGSRHHARAGDYLYEFMEEDQRVFHAVLRDATLKLAEKQRRRETQEEMGEFENDSDSFAEDEENREGAEDEDDDGDFEEGEEYIQWTEKVVHSSQVIRRRRRGSSNLLMTIWEAEEGSGRVMTEDERGKKSEAMFKDYECDYSSSYEGETEIESFATPANYATGRHDGSWLELS
ncbi:Serine/threonine-protein kinase ulk3 [Ceratocystis pirilliformis]|uniref:Serine/threonine-protein kinase ulk3 n=1 Tax=Ceratocystis pirilliformis TaxID=259994 RepID=A0ABR3Z2I0_9PEZI